MKIAIAGPGRSGTSFLVELFSAWGFNAIEGDLHEDALAGREVRLGKQSPYEVDKDPWAFEYIDRLSADDIQIYDLFLIPIREIGEASRSRSVQERFQRAVTLDEDFWMWNAWGVSDGGALSRTSANAIRSVLEGGLWVLIETLSKYNANFHVLHFPRLATDFEYLWSHVESIVSERINKADAQSIFLKIADSSKIRIGKHSEQEDELTNKELIELVNMLRKKIKDVNQKNEEITRSLSECSVEFNEMQQKSVELEAHVNTLTNEISSLQRHLREIDQHRKDLAGSVNEKNLMIEQLEEELRLIQNTKSWRITRPLRRLLAFKNRFRF